MDTYLTKLDDDLLLRWKRERDPEAFAVLVQRHAAMVYGTCLRILKNHHAAEDLAQECFLTFTQRPPRSGERIGPWLHTVAVRRSLNRLRAEGRRARREDRVAEAEPAAAQSHAWSELFAEVDTAIEELPEDLRDLVVRHYLEGKTHAEIADALKLSRTTVTSRIQQAVALIRKRMDRKGIALSAGVFAEGLAALRAEAAPAPLMSRLGKVALAGRTPALVGWMPATVYPVILTGLFIALIGAVVFTVGNYQPPAPAAQNPPPAVAIVVPTENDQGPVTTAPEAASTLSEPVASPTVVAQANGATVDVHVLGTDNKPVPGATVVTARVPIILPILGLPSDAEVSARVLTNDAGVVATEAAASGELVVAAYKSGVGWGIVNQAAADRDPIVLRLKPFASVSMRLVDKATNDPVRGMSVKLGYWANDSWQLDGIRLLLNELDVSEVRTPLNADGVFVHEDLVPQKYSLNLEGDTQYAVPSRPTVDLQPGESRALEFALERGGSISGVVVDSDGHPIEGVSVGYRSEPPFEFGDRSGSSTYSDGRFRFTGLPAGLTYTLSLHHSDYGRREITDIAVPRPEEVAGLRVELVTGRRVTGRITDDTGQPIEGIFIGISKLASTVLTNDAGEFVLEHVTPGDGYFSVMPGPGSELRTPTYDVAAFKYYPVSISPDTDPAPFNLVIPRLKGGFVAGRVVNTAGEPVAGVRVRADSLKFRGLLEVSTGFDGRFRIEGLGDAGQVDVSTFPGDNGYAFIKIENVPVNTADLELVVHRLSRIAGRVVTETGAPVTSYRIRSSTTNLRSILRGQWKEFSNAKGEFLIDEVTPGRVAVEVEARGYAPGRHIVENVAPEETVTGVEVKLAGGWQGRVRAVDASTAQPLPDAKVRAWTAQDNQTELRGFLTNWMRPVTEYERDEHPILGDHYITPSIVTDGEGIAVLPLMNVDGTFGVVAWMDGYAPAIQGPLQKTPANGDITLHLVRPATLRIHVPGASEQYYFDAYQRDVAPERSASAFRRDFRFGNEGSMASYDGFPAGEYGIFVTTRDPVTSLPQQQAYLRVSLVAGETVDVEIDLGNLGSMFGSVAGTMAGPIKIGYVTFLRRAPGGIEEAIGWTTIENGEFHATGLPPGPATMVVRAGELRSEKPVVITAGATESVTVDQPR